MKMLTILIFTTLFFTYNLLATNVATITAIKGHADIQKEGTIIIASLGSKLDKKDTIITKDNSKIQVIFKDETTITIGKNSEFSVQEYLFEESSQPIATFSILRGAVHIITGKIAKVAPKKFSVHTKTATIGIRGTQFSLFTQDDGSLSAYCTFGAISVAISGTTYIVQQGFYLLLSPVGDVSIKEFKAKDLKTLKKKHFESDKKIKKQAHLSDKSTKNLNTLDNDSLLDIGLDDYSDIVIKDIAEMSGDAIQNSNNDISTPIQPEGVSGQQDFAYGH